MTITFDFETKSYADLKKVGAWAYSEHPTTDVICACWGEYEDEIEEWWPGKNATNDCLKSLVKAIEKGELFEAHNAPFEISIWRNIMARKYGWPEPLVENWRDTMAVACYYALPAALDRLAHVLGFEGKDPAGGRLITKYSKLYLKTAKTVIPPEDLRRSVGYCRQDVRIVQSVSDFMGDLPEDELVMYQLDKQINLRGLYLDQDGIDAASGIVDQRAAILTKEFRTLTGYNPGQQARLLEWFAEQGVQLENMQADYLRELLDDGAISRGIARRALEIRLAVNKASTKKLDAMSRQRGANGRARFQTRYHGAVTGRSTGSGFQPLNLNRGFGGMDPTQLTRDIMYGDAAYLDALYGDATDAVAKASRYWIQAQPGNKIMAGDYVSVEAVLLACLAGEQWKIDAFAKGVKIYEFMADKIYGLEPGTVTKATHPVERQDGKTGELAFGYQGALGAWLNFDSSGRHTDERIIEICKAWRAEHPQTVALWAGLQSAAIAAVSTREPQSFTPAGRGYRAITFEVVDEWLTMVLPNGKRLWYWKPELRMKMPQWHQPTSKTKCAAGTCDCQPRLQLCYKAQKEGQWRTIYTYGGKLCLADDTQVLTDRGWLGILEVQVYDRLWDGENWVRHDGLIYQGHKNVVDLHGVRMTADHPVLTTEGWKNASQSEGYYRAQSWLPSGQGVRWKQWQEIPLDSRVRMRNEGEAASFRASENEKARSGSFLWMHEKENNFGTLDYARNVEASRIRRLALDGRPMQAAFASSMAKLWRTRDHCMQKVAKFFRKFLVRHGANVSAGAYLRAQQQRWQLPAQQLPLGYAGGAVSQQTDQCVYTHTKRDNDCCRGLSHFWDQRHYNPLPATTRVAGRESVYDIANAGPNSRFVVRDKDGQPLIVHNCENLVQAVSREVLKEAMLRLAAEYDPALRRAGALASDESSIILTVYDEIVAEVPKDFSSKDEFEAIMGEVPEWAAGWPIKVDAWIGDRYKK